MTGSNPIKKSKALSGQTDSVSDVQLTGTKGSVVKEHSIQSAKSDNAEAVKV